MIVDLESTTAAAVTAEIARQRRRYGTYDAGVALTLVVPTDERHCSEALDAATAAAMAYPCRILVVIRRTPSAAPRLDAQVRVGGSTGPGETAVLRLRGPLGDHAESVVLPLLLSDAPVVVWWPTEAPDVPGASPLGRLAQRRVTDAAATPRSDDALRRRAKGYQPGDTDFAWTRLTPWRTLLAAALDHPFDPIRSAEVGAARGNPSADLLAAWLGAALGVETTVRTTRGPGITQVRLVTTRGDIAVTRPDGLRATLSRPGQPDRRVALPRRTTADLLSEELRRLDADEPYAQTLAALRATRRPRKAAR
ncbi:MAG TPA: glucose-6-phosphate dehydrogenase assembly protein OpcA [Mycobacteriales bacterium]|nr:glucose-6-phosphate dehydrogenase assembly protein OpcA [Mycobacteriales bacterium]